MLKYIISLFLLTPATVWGWQLIANGVVTSTEGTPIITQDTDDGGTNPADPNAYTIGQSFTMPTGKTSIKEIKLYVHAAGTDATLILDDDTDLSADTLGSATISIPGTGYVTFTLNVTGLTPGAIYYFGLPINSTTTDFRRATTSVYADGTYRYNSGAYSLASTLIGHDLRFIITE